MLTELQKNEVYMWVYPQSANGLKFKVVRLLPNSYLIRYLNYRHFQTAKNEVLEISREFVDNHILDILRVVKA